jgi:hypothetical protein
MAFQVAQALDRVGDGAPVGQRTAQPAVVHVVLGAAGRGLGDRLGGLALGADEQNPAALGGDVAHGDQGLVHQRQRLRQVDDVNVRARAEDVAVHLRVPAVGLVAEVGARFEQGTHGDVRQSHLISFLYPIKSAADVDRLLRALGMVRTGCLPETRHACV